MQCEAVLVVHHRHPCCGTLPGLLISGHGELERALSSAKAGSATGKTLASTLSKQRAQGRTPRASGGRLGDVLGLSPSCATPLPHVKAGPVYRERNALRKKALKRN